MPYTPHSSTVIFVCAFLVLYMAAVTRRALRSGLDVFDWMLLSTVAVVPAFLVLLPTVANRISALIGVAFPFVVSFGFTFFIVFVYLYRLAVRTEEHDKAVVTLVQDVALLRFELEQSHDASASGLDDAPRHAGDHGPASR